MISAQPISKILIRLLLGRAAIGERQAHGPYHPPLGDEPGPSIVHPIAFAPAGATSAVRGHPAIRRSVEHWPRPKGKAPDFRRTGSQ